MSFIEIHPREITTNVIKLIGREWMLITSGSKEHYNMMTASWGGLGILWYKPVCFIFVRQSRYTYQFLEKNDHFSIGFFTEDYKPVLNLLGSKSAREINKMKEVDLTPIDDSKTIYFEESRMVLICKKLYHHDIANENFVSEIRDDIYKDNDFHRMYICEIEKCLIKSE
ncbi:MAG: flavin reductase family protein [Asgard group archaeon]|nr:flavin reductase family protein [Asgard group archaeon]